MLVMTGANSAVGLRSMPVRYLFLDEVDGYPLDVEGEGMRSHLAEARTRHVRAAQDLHRLDADDLRASAPSNASTRPVTNVATLCRVRIARTGSGCVSSSCVGTKGATGDRCLHLRVM